MLIDELIKKLFKIKTINNELIKKKSKNLLIKSPKKANYMYCKH